MDDPHTIKKILLNLSVDEYPRVCQNSKNFNQVCHDETFWREKFAQDGLFWVQPWETVDEYIREYQISQVSMKLALIYYDFAIHQPSTRHEDGDIGITGLVIFGKQIGDIHDFFVDDMSEETKRELLHDFQKDKYGAIIERQGKNPVIQNYIYKDEKYRYPWQNVARYFGGYSGNSRIEIELIISFAYLYPGDFYLVTQLTERDSNGEITDEFPETKLYPITHDQVKKIFFNLVYKGYRLTEYGMTFDNENIPDKAKSLPIPTGEPPYDPNLEVYLELDPKTQWETRFLNVRFVEDLSPDLQFNMLYWLRRAVPTDKIPELVLRLEAEPDPNKQSVIINSYQ